MEIFHRAPFRPRPGMAEISETIAGQAAIAIDNAALFQGLQQSNLELYLAYDATIEGWSHALDLRDQETEGHTQRVTEMTGQLARLWAISQVEMVQIRRGALLHDIGKMAMPDAILLKPGKLTACRMGDHAPAPAACLRDALAHRLPAPGAGYPLRPPRKMGWQRLPARAAGEQIPLAARIFAVMDVWDAVTSDRPYRPAWTKERAIAHIRAGAGTFFDPRVVDAFLDMLSQEMW